MASITKKADGKYLIRVSKGTGKGRTYINKTFRGTLAKAREFAREQETLIDQGFKRESGLDFNTYFELWLKAIAPKLAPRTLDGYEGYIRRYALEPLRRLQLKDIRPHHIQAIILATDKAPATVRQLHASLKACFSYAARKEWIRTSPCKYIDLPEKDVSDMQVLMPDEAGVFIKVTRTKMNGLIFEFALETGMRPEEYLGLRWSDLDGCDVMIQQVVQFHRSGGGYYFRKTKTKRSRRRVEISENLRRMLHRHRIEQHGWRLKMSGTWYDHGLVFPNSIGRPYPLNNLTRRYFKPVLDACGFEKHLTLYSLRHSCATLMLMNGENPKTVSDRLGSSVKTILETYSHVTPGIQAEATNKLDKILRMKTG